MSEKQPCRETGTGFFNTAYSQIIETIPYGVQVNDLNGAIIYVNSFMERISGYSAKELMGIYIWDLIEPGEQKDALPEYLQYLIKEQPIPSPYYATNIKKNGQKFDLRVDWNYLRNEGGEIEYFVSILSDISNQKDTRKKDNDQKYRVLFEKSTDAIILAAKDHFIDCNSAALNLLQFESKKDLLQASFLELSPEVQPDGKKSMEKIKELQQTILVNGSSRFEWLFKKSNGDTFYADVLLDEISLENGELLYVHIWRDITERKREESEQKELLHNLGERVKELNGMYSLGKLTEKIDDLDSFLDEFLQNVVPPSMQYPDKVIARICLDDKIYQNIPGDFSVKLVSPLLVNFLFRGELEIGYTESLSFIESFEQNLLDGYAERLGKIIEMKEAEAELKEKNKQLERLSISDGLTGLYNHNYIIDSLTQEIMKSDRYSHPLSVMVVDLDFFKKINDTFGHQTGDHVLKTAASILKKNLREIDIIGRYGGEEFLIILPFIECRQAVAVAERMRCNIEKLKWKNKKIKITISAGVATYTDEDTTTLIAKADKLLYQAKIKGRNRIESQLY